MEIDRLFDIARIDIVAIDQNHVLQPVNDEGIALLIGIADIGRVQPPVLQGIGGGIIAPPITLHDLRTTDADLTHLTQRQDGFPILKRDDLDGCARYRQAD